MEFLQPVELIEPMDLAEEFNTVFQGTIECNRGYVCSKGTVKL